jgi:hypothetical protein
VNLPLGTNSDRHDLHYDDTNIQTNEKAHGISMWSHTNDNLDCCPYAIKQELTPDPVRPDERKAFIKGILYNRNPSSDVAICYKIDKKVLNNVHNWELTTPDKDGHHNFRPKQAFSCKGNGKLFPQTTTGNKKTRRKVRFFHPNITLTEWKFCCTMRKLMAGAHARFGDGNYDELGGTIVQLLENEDELDDMIEHNHEEILDQITNSSGFTIEKISSLESTRKEYFFRLLEEFGYSELVKSAKEWIKTNAQTDDACAALTKMNLSSSVNQIWELWETDATFEDRFIPEVRPAF